MFGMRDVSELIKACGGPEAIEREAGVKPGKAKRPKLSHWAVRKWSQSGIPERHWPLVMKLTKTDIGEIYAANEAARAAAREAA